MFNPGDIVKDILDLPNGPKFIVVRELSSTRAAIRSYVLQNTLDGELYMGFESQLVRLEEDGAWRGIDYEKEQLLCSTDR